MAVPNLVAAVLNVAVRARDGCPLVTGVLRHRGVACLLVRAVPGIHLDAVV